MGIKTPHRYTRAQREKCNSHEPHMQHGNKNQIQSLPMPSVHVSFLSSYSAVNAPGNCYATAEYYRATYSSFAVICSPRCRTGAYGLGGITTAVRASAAKSGNSLHFSGGRFLQTP